MHGGVEYQALGTTTEFFNGGESNQVDRFVRNRVLVLSRASSGGARMQWSRTAIRWLGVCVLMGVVSAATASPARAQGSADPNPGAVTLTGGFDFANAYFFRGIPQDDTGVVMWPSAISASRSTPGTVASRVLG